VRKIVYIDIGELGWSFYLSAHIRWLKEKKRNDICIITFPERFCLYENITDSRLPVTDYFQKRYKDCQQDGFGLYRQSKRVLDKELKHFFLKYLPEKYVFAPDMMFGLNHYSVDEMIFLSYPCFSDNAKNRILIFPRHRKGIYAKRNLPIDFYRNLIISLCKKFPLLQITAVGIMKGSYSFVDIKEDNFVNLCEEKRNVQTVIDMCGEAVAAIGGASALPKLSLLQKVPTFIIGHEKERMISENWINTKFNLFEIEKDEYNSFYKSFQCIERAINFVERCDK